MTYNLEPSFDQITPLMLASTSYGGVRGDGLSESRPNPDCSAPPAATQSNGCITDVAPIRLASISDGTSSTLMLAERSISAFRPLNVPWDGQPPGVNPYTLSGWWFSGSFDDTLTTAAYPPNVFQRLVPSALNSDAWVSGASSLHPGGLNVAMADGSVRFIVQTIDSWDIAPTSATPAGPTPGVWPSRGVWQAISTRNGGEIVASGFY